MAVPAPPQAAPPAQQTRTSNQRLLLRLLRLNSPCSKADLVRLSGLTAPTVSLVASRLIASGLAHDLGEGASSGGRPPAMLRFNARHGFVAGVDIGGTRLRMMLADLNGEPVAEWKTHLQSEAHKTPQGIVRLIRQGLDSMVAQTGKGTRVLHLAAGAPGITDRDRGVVLAAPNLPGWDNVQLRALLEEELAFPVSVENDTNLAAVGERARGVARGVDDFVFLAMGTGVGAGIYLRGALHHGATWSAGEVGYLPVLGAARQTVRMRETGQLERIIGGAGIERSWQQLLQEHGIADSDLHALRAPQIFDLAVAEDTPARPEQPAASWGRQESQQILQDTARILADALSTVALLYNPELIVLGGGVGAHPALCTATELYLQQNDFALPRLRSSSLGTQAQLFGAVSVALSAAESALLC